MAGLEEKLCPVCFQEAMEHGECRNCGYHAEESSAVKDYLAPFTILKEKYLLGKSLGQGGFGITYLAENMQSGLRCCIKEYFPSGLLQGRTPDGALILADEENRPEYEEGKQQFIEEACALQELRENISVVDILDFFEENGTAYFAMELIEGCNLRVFRKNHNPKQTLKMALQMLFLLGSSLAEVHRFGMIHGDISPENILITQDGEIKLIDFGAARSFRQGSDNKERKIYLKPNYAPYEQYTQKPCQGPWTDIYALAATFYFMKKSTANHMHRKRRKNNLTWLFALLGILVLFLGTILAFLIFSNLSSKPTETVQEVSAVNVEKDIPETDMGDLIYHEPAAENVVMQGGFGYVNNELLVTLDSSDSLSALKDYLRTIGGEVVGEIPVTADYQILLPAAHTQEELEQMIEQLKALPYVRRSSLNYAFELENDAISGSSAYYPNDKKWDDWSGNSGNNWNMKAIDAPGAWVYRNQMQPVNVGVIDGIFYPYHEDLKDVFQEMPLGNASANVVAGESCVAMWPEKWNDLANSNVYEQSGYICEWEASDVAEETQVEGYTGHLYEFYTLPESEWESGPITWQQAERRCEWKGGHLAVIESSTENFLLYSAMKAKGYENAYFG